jgi:MFS family permease
MKLGTKLSSFLQDIFGDRFKIVYWVIAVATAQHTAWGAAITMQGSNGEGQIWWWLQGLAFAIAIDISMVMIATKIRNRGNRNVWMYAITFLIVAGLSFFFQLLYTWSHISELTQGTGIAIEWAERLQGVINARLIIAPFALPLISILYTISGLGKGGEAQRKPQPVQREVASSATSRIEVDVDRLPPPQYIALTDGLQWHNGGYVERNGDAIVAYICPGCEKQLSIAGWSRHKKSCKQYIAKMSIAQVASISMNGNGHKAGDE